LSSIEDSEHFALFAHSVKSAIARYGHLPDEDADLIKKTQVDKLADLEVQFRKALINDPNGTAAYSYFIDHILENNKNILTARPYFRERRTFFAPYVSSAIRTKNLDELQKFHVNYHFINFVSSRFEFGEDVTSLVTQIQAARQKLIEMNLPLVINRARIFWSRTHKSHLSFMDLVQIGTEGLIAAIDKYAAEYSGMWAGVAVGRMVGNFIEQMSSTLIHFYPSDKKKLYKANKFKATRFHGDFDIDDLVKYVESEGKGGDKTSPGELTALMAAAAIVSADATPTADTECNVPDSVAKYEAPEELRPDLLVETREATDMMYTAMCKLTLLQKKLLRLKGVDISLE
jgi:DNA-directed RNA polymerase specialized sigma subunit